MGNIASHPILDNLLEKQFRGNLEKYKHEICNLKKIEKKQRN